MLKFSDFWPLRTPLNCLLSLLIGFPGWSVIKNPPPKTGDVGLIPGLGRSLGEGNDNPFQYSCLENPMDRGAWWAQSTGPQRVGHD